MPPPSASCDECGSPFERAVSPMPGLCPECAHWLYGYENCPHDRRDGRCTRCGWNGSVSPYVAKLKSEAQRDDERHLPDD